MAVKAVGTWVPGFCEIGRSDIGGRRTVAGAACRRSEVSMVGGRLERAGVCMKPVEDVKPMKDENFSSVPPSSEVDGEAGNGGAEEQLSKLNRDLPSGLLPKPLSLTGLTVSSHGSNVRVAYQGCPGAFSEAAALKAYPQCVAVPCEQFEVAFKAVELWLVDKAVLPIENSVGGSIHRNYDLLLCHRLHIVGEVQMAVNHCLMTLPGVKKEKIKRVLSHPQALAQCEIALSKLGVIRESVDDTALAAQLVASNDLRDAGAVASARAAEIYGLEIVEERILVSIVILFCLELFTCTGLFDMDTVMTLIVPQEGILDTKRICHLHTRTGAQHDTPDNITRFLILAREPIIPRADRLFKTSIVFTLEEGSGVLFKALAVFALRNINLTKIESRPQRKRPLRVVDDSNYGTAKYFDYLFYIDFEASMAEPRAQNALAHLQEFATFLRVLGCYPMDTSL